jgi:hypothetical protein
MKSFSLGTICVALISLAACGGSDGDGANEGLGNTSSFEGIYQLTAASENTAGCATPGDSKLAKLSDQFFAITPGEIFGIKYLTLNSCSSVADCQAKRAKQQEGQPYPVEFTFTLSSSTNATTLNGFEAGTGRGEGTQCVERTYADHVLTVAADHSVHLESRTKMLADQPKDKEGYCWVEPAKSKQEAAGKECSNLEVFDATFVQAQ